MSELLTDTFASLRFFVPCALRKLISKDLEVEQNAILHTTELHFLIYHDAKQGLNFIPSDTHNCDPLHSTICA